MKIITILSLCLTASLSFAHSETQDKVKNDAFTYDYSQVCADIQNCTFPATFDALYKKSYAFFDIYDLSPSECTNFAFITEIHGIPPCPIQYRDLRIKKYGFSSKADANAYFNINILNNMPNNQLGYSLRWMTKISYMADHNKPNDINVFKNHYFMSFGGAVIEPFYNPTKSYKKIYFPKQPQAILDELNNFNTIFLWIEDDIKHITFDTALHAEQHQLLIHPLANKTTTYIDTKHMKDAEDVSIRLYQSPSTWIIENNTNSNITALLCADDSRKIEENRVYGYGSPNGCIKMPIEYVSYSNKLHPKCIRQLEPFSSQFFDSSVFLKKQKNHESWNIHQ